MNAFAGFFQRNGKVIGVGLLLGGVVEYLLIRGKFYDQMIKSKSNDIDNAWAELSEDEEKKNMILEIEKRYQKVKNKS